MESAANPRGRGRGGATRGGATGAGRGRGAAAGLRGTVAPKQGASHPDNQASARGGNRGRGRGQGPSGRGAPNGIGERPTRTKKNHHPGQIIIDNSIQRRTSEQKKADLDRQAAEKAAAEAAAHATKVFQQQQVAALEDDVQARHASWEAQKTRPDLQLQEAVAAAAAQEIENDISEDIAMQDGEIEADAYLECDEGGDSEFADSEMPPDSAIESESCPSEGISGTWEGDEGEEEGEYEGDDGEWQDDKSERESEGEEAYLVRQKGKSAPKPKAERGDFRIAVGAYRQVPGPAVSQPGKKRKSDDTEVAVGSTAANGTNAKRNKPSEPGGLLASYKLKAALAKKKNVKKLSEDQSAKEEDDAIAVDGEFDQEEGADALSAARAAKLNTVKIQNGSKAANIKVTEVKLVGNGRIKSDKFHVSSLPFPVESRQACHNRWQKVFRATLISWAGCIEDPFGAISKLDKETALQMWDSVFPDIVLEDRERQGLPPKLVYLASNILIDWRNSIGKNAVRIVNESLCDCDLEAAQIAAFVKEALDPNKWPFIYASPEGETAAMKGAFKSDYILEIYAIHLKKTTGAVASFTSGPQSGGLGLCVAAIERGLSYWKAGIDKSFKLDKNNAKKPASTFAEQLWGLSARGWTQAAMRLSPEKWGEIHEGAVVYGRGDVVDDESEQTVDEVAEVTSRSLIEL